MTTSANFPDWHGTTILAVRKGGKTVIAGDGQVSMGQTVVKGNARKVRTLAGNLQLVQLAPWLLDPRRNPLWFRFVGHKMLRLAAPWALVLLGVAAMALAPRHGFYLACALAALAGLALVAAAPRLPRLAGLAPVRLLVAFVHMNLFAAQAALAFVRGRRLHLW